MGSNPGRCSAPGAGSKLMRQIPTTTQRKGENKRSWNNSCDKQKPRDCRVKAGPICIVSLGASPVQTRLEVGHFILSVSVSPPSHLVRWPNAVRMLSVLLLQKSGFSFQRQLCQAQSPWNLEWLPSVSGSFHVTFCESSQNWYYHLYLTVEGTAAKRQRLALNHKTTWPRSHLNSRLQT